MNTFSREHLFFVSSGGIIRYYSPLYISEGTAQVSTHTIKCIEFIREYKNIDDAFLFYDNMCNLGKPQENKTTFFTSPTHSSTMVK